MLPAELLDSLKGVTGFNEAAFIKVHSSGEKVTSIRYNPAKIEKVNYFSSPRENQTSIFKDEYPVPWCPYGRYLSERPYFTLDPLLHGGTYYVQEASSMFLWHLLEKTIGKNSTLPLKVLDVSAAPGGKSTLLSSYFSNGLVLANEVVKSRAAILVENITKWGAGNVVVTSNEPKDFSKLPAYFDVIVVDAPCSGSGLFRKDPGAIAEWSIDNVLYCNQRQERILADVQSALKNEGILIYSTCSYSKEEDEDILDWLTESFEFTTLRVDLEPDWKIVETVSAKGAYGYRFYPDKIQGEGFFIAAFKKKNGEEYDYNSHSLLPASKNEKAVLNSWINQQEDLFYFKQNENIIVLKSQWQKEVALLQKKLYLKTAGITAGSFKGKDFIPAHALALSLLLNENVQKIDINSDDALSYLKRKELDLKNISPGWTVVSYCGLNLGWIKVLPARINNYYPLQWRILKG